MVELILAILVAGSTPVTNETDRDLVALRVRAYADKQVDDSDDTARVGGRGAPAGVGRTRRGMASLRHGAIVPGRGHAGAGDRRHPFVPRSAERPRELRCCRSRRTRLGRNGDGLGPLRGRRRISTDATRWNRHQPAARDAEARRPRRSNRRARDRSPARHQACAVRSDACTSGSRRHHRAQKGDAALQPGGSAQDADRSPVGRGGSPTLVGRGTPSQSVAAMTLDEKRGLSRRRPSLRR